MGDKLKIGDFGYFEFEIKKLVDHKYYKQLFFGHYEVVDEDKKNIELWDGQVRLIVTRRRIYVFERKRKPNMTFRFMCKHKANSLLKRWGHIAIPN